MTDDPVVSVILAVRNGGSDLPTAVASILDQTWRSLELIVVDNGSTDATPVFLASLSDPRVRRLRYEQPGLAGSLNVGIAQARGRYIARQDHDDIALPSRFEKQVSFLDSRPAVALLGTRAEIRTGDQPSGRAHDHPANNTELQFDLLFDNPFVHSSVMIRKSALDDVGLYTTDPERQPPEDYELWSRLARDHEIANLPERLTIYREVPGSLSRSGPDPFLRKLVLISSENLAHWSGAAVVSSVHRDIAALIHGAHELVSEDPDMQAMQSVIQEAGRRIGRGAIPGDIQLRIDAKLRRLRRLLMMRDPRLRPLGLFARRLRDGVRRAKAYIQ